MPTYFDSLYRKHSTAHFDLDFCCLNNVKLLLVRNSGVYCGGMPHRVHSFRVRYIRRLIIFLLVPNGLCLQQCPSYWRTLLDAGQALVFTKLYVVRLTLKAHDITVVSLLLD